MGMTLRFADPEERHAAVRLCSDLPGERDFAREDGTWVLHVERPGLKRLEYQLELVGHDGSSEVICDPGNERTAPGVFGAKSVLTAEGYREPAWLAADVEPGSVDDRGLWSPPGADPAEPLPLLAAHDGPEYDEFSSLTRYAAAMIAGGELPPFRVALLEPGDRDERYSASAHYARRLCQVVLGSLPIAGRPVGMGASLGALAMLHAQRRFPGTFAALFLQSGSFFMPRYDSHESGFVRYRRIVRFVREMGHRSTADPIPVTLTCGAEEENIHNNRVMAEALAAQGYDARLHEVGDLHNYVGWRDAFDPYLTEVLRRVWT